MGLALCSELYLPHLREPSQQLEEEGLRLREGQQPPAGTNLPSGRPALSPCSSRWPTFSPTTFCPFTSHTAWLVRSPLWAAELPLTTETTFPFLRTKPMWPTLSLCMVTVRWKGLVGRDSELGQDVAGGREGGWGPGYPPVPNDHDDFLG